MKQYEESLGIQHRGIQTISQRAEQLFEVLPGDARLKVGTCCKPKRCAGSCYMQVSADAPCVLHVLHSLGRSVIACTFSWHLQ